MQRAVCAPSTPAYLSMRNTESSPPRCADWHWRHLDAVSALGPGQPAQLGLVLQGHTVVDRPPKQCRLPQFGQRGLGFCEGIVQTVLPALAFQQFIDAQHRVAPEVRKLAQATLARAWCP